MRSHGVTFSIAGHAEWAPGLTTPQAWAQVSRALELPADLAHAEPQSRTAFSMSVHNATAGLLTIARADRANHIELAAGAPTLEHALLRLRDVE